jgi:hypothetical protein
MRSEGKQYFFEKKHQKTFVNSVPGFCSTHAQINKSFFGSFFSKKELLPSRALT